MTCLRERRFIFLLYGVVVGGTYGVVVAGVGGMVLGSYGAGVGAGGYDGGCVSPYGWLGAA
jgi:hypothetical protein